MKKYVSRKKTCCLSFSINSLNAEQIKNLLNWLLKKGYYHFYLSKKHLGKPTFKALQKKQKIYKGIKIFVIHDHKEYFWQQENITNLPIDISSKQTNYADSEIYLLTYCEIYITKTAECFLDADRTNCKYNESKIILFENIVKNF